MFSRLKISSDFINVDAYIIHTMFADNLTENKSISIRLARNGGGRAEMKRTE
jgi:hypothetical protein